MVSGACRCGVSLLSSVNAMGRGEKWMGDEGRSWEDARARDSRKPLHAQEHKATKSRRVTVDEAEDQILAVAFDIRCKKLSLSGQAQLYLRIFGFKTGASTAAFMARINRADCLPHSPEGSEDCGYSVFQSPASLDPHLLCVRRLCRHAPNPNASGSRPGRSRAQFQVP